MPLDADQIWRKEDILTGGELKAIIEAEYGPLVPITTGDPSETARRYTFSDGIGEVGFINPVSEPFCSSCDRIRLTADGPASSLPKKPTCALFCAPGPQTKRSHRRCGRPSGTRN